MFHVQTVSGPIAPDALGHSQIHEHIFVHRTPMAEKNPALRLDDPARSLKELRAYRAAGGGFLADAQPVAAGRDAERLGALSRESSVAVAASTGYHLLGFYPADCWVHSLDEEGLYDLYCGELLEGMLPWRPEPDRRPAQPTAFRAGLVKAAPKCLFVYLILSPFLSEEEVEKIFGRNMLQDEEMKPLLDQLTGIQEEKPFECVGSRDEINSAIVLTIERMEKEGKKLPLLFEHYKETGLYERYQTEKNKFSAYFDSSNLVPEPWEKFVRERCTKEA